MTCLHLRLGIFASMLLYETPNVVTYLNLLELLQPSEVIEEEIDYITPQSGGKRFLGVELVPAVHDGGISNRDMLEHKE